MPAGHKVALRPIGAGDNIVRYGQMMGRARVAIEAGQHVHTHNVGFEELAFDYEFPVGERQIALPSRSTSPLSSDMRGRMDALGHGTTSQSSPQAIARLTQPNRSRRATTVTDLPPGVDGVVAFPHGEGCGHSIGPDTDQLRRTLAGVLDHPNVAGAIILGLGCETNQIEHYLGPDAPEVAPARGHDGARVRRNTSHGRSGPKGDRSDARTSSR